MIRFITFIILSSKHVFTIISCKVETADYLTIFLKDFKIEGKSDVHQH